MRRPYGYECPDPMCDFERYAPLHGEPYAIPDGSPSGYNESTGKFRETDSAGNASVQVSSPVIIKTAKMPEEVSLITWVIVDSHRPQIDSSHSNY